MSAPYVVNVSSVQDFMQCRYRWACKWVLNRVPRTEGDALFLGKVIHSIFESYFRDGVPLQEVALVHRMRIDGALALGDVPAWDRPAWERAGQFLADMHDAWPLWRDVYPMGKTLEVERPFEITFAGMPGVLFRGRPDRVAEMDGYAWHVQNRGLSAQMNFGTYVRLAKRHFHEHLYAEYIDREYAALGGCGGTVFNLLRKLKYRTKVTKKKPLGEVRTAAEMFYQHPMSIRLDSDNHRRVMDDLFKHVREMRLTEARVLHEKWMPAPNDKLNGGYSGNSEDPYFRLLIGEIRLDDDQWFKAREDTYSVADTGTE